MSSSLTNFATTATPAKNALNPGITGQYGSYLAELLLWKGYQVCGINRRASSFYTTWINHLCHFPYESDTHLVLPAVISPTAPT